MKLTVVIERGETSYGAYAPDLPGCITVGETKEEVLRLVKEAIEFRLEGLKEEGEPLPASHCEFAQVEVNHACSMGS